MEGGRGRSWEQRELRAWLRGIFLSAGFRNREGQVLTVFQRCRQPFLSFSCWSLRATVGFCTLFSSAILSCLFPLPSICHAAELECVGGLGLSVGLASSLFDSEVVLGSRSCPHAPAGLRHGRSAVPEHVLRPAGV